MNAPTQMRYYDFELLVTKETNDEYLVRAISTPAGDARGILSIDPESQDLQIAQQRLEEGNTDLNFLKEIGGSLFRALFVVDGVRDSFYHSLGLVEGEQRGLRIRLNIEPPELSTVPWEYLYDEGKNYFLATSPKIILSRYLQVQQPIRDLLVSPPLKVLVAISNPSNLADWGMAPVNVAEERKTIQSALGKLKREGKVKLSFLTKVTTSNLRKRLREGYHVFHFIGHGGFRENPGGILYIEDEQGRCKIIDETSFQALFLDNPTTKLAILSACKGAKGSSTRPFVGMAHNLVRRGLPAVIAMQYSIRMTTNRLFVGELYAALASGWPVDACVSEARKAIFMDVGPARRDWGIPVLFMRARDGRVLDFQSSKEERIVKEAQGAIQSIKEHTTDEGLSALNDLIESLKEFAELHNYLRELNEWNKLLRGLDSSFSSVYEEVKRLHVEGMAAWAIDRAKVVNSWELCKGAGISELTALAQAARFIGWEAQEAVDSLVKVQRRIDSAIKRNNYGSLIDSIREFHALLNRYCTEGMQRLSETIARLSDLSNRLAGRYER